MTLTHGVSEFYKFHGIHGGHIGICGGEIRWGGDSVLEMDCRGWAISFSQVTRKHRKQAQNIFFAPAVLVLVPPWAWVSWVLWCWPLVPSRAPAGLGSRPPLVPGSWVLRVRARVALGSRVPLVLGSWGSWVVH